jgi:hypothetical protein
MQQNWGIKMKLDEKQNVIPGIDRFVLNLKSNKNNMKRGTSAKFFIAFLGMVIICHSCKEGPDKPDVSGINIKLDVKRFEKHFFSLDTNNLDQDFEALRSSEYHNFLMDFTGRLLGLNGVDTAKWDMLIKQFIREYKPIYDSTVVLDKEVEKAAQDVKMAFRYVKYYFPQYKLPEQFITFVGPIDAFAYGATGGSGEIITTFAICAGLQLHLGSNSIVYKSQAGQELYPEYISQRFTTDYIVVNSIKTIIDDIHPSLQPGAKMIDIIADHGKRMYLLDLILPDTKETLKLGYTEAQLKGCKESEGFIWNYFTENNLLFETDLLKTRSFLNDGPSTPEFGLGSPGFISLFTGRELIRAYMKKNPKTTIDELLALDGQKILTGSGYKPR